MSEHAITTISSALREARARLKLHDYICIVLTFDVKGDAARRAAEVVSFRLACPLDDDRAPCAERWLESRGFRLSPEERLEWRLVWLDKLIHEFETKGD